MTGHTERGFYGIALAILRIVVGLLVFEHGAQKLFGMFGGFMGEPGPAVEIFSLEIFSLMGIGGVFEFFGGLAVMIGLFTRPVAFILSGQMAVAYFLFHASKGLMPIQNGGELAVLYCFVFLFLSVAGAGRFSLDGKRGK